MSGADRGQAYTLEGLIAAVLIASAVLYGLQAVDVAPYAEDRGGQDLETIRTQAEDALRTLGDRGELRRAATCLNTTSGHPHVLVGQPPSADPATGNVTALGHVLNQSLGYDRDYLVLFDYWNASSDAVDTVVVYPNQASANPSFTREPVTASHRVTVYDSTPVRAPEATGTGRFACQPIGETMGERYDNTTTAAPYVPNAYPASGDPQVYSTITVRVIVW